MSETPWTPGPWIVRVAGKANLPYGITAPDQPYDRKGGIRDITRWAAITLPSSKEGQANARLIAAAPEMAEALECLAAMAAHFPTVKTYGNRPRSGAIYSVSDMHLGEAAITVEDLHRAAALLSRIRGDMP